jgi:hypothetical protein
MEEENLENFPDPISGPTVIKIKGFLLYELFVSSFLDWLFVLAASHIFGELWLAHL